MLFCPLPLIVKTALLAIVSVLPEFSVPLVQLMVPTAATVPPRLPPLHVRLVMLPYTFRLPPANIAFCKLL